MTDPATLSLGRTDSGYLVRISGRGTLKESVALHAYLVKLIEQGCGHLVIELSECSYLDSTFLGCLVDLHKHCKRSGLVQFSIAAPSRECEALFRKTRLSTILEVTDRPPVVVGEWVTLADAHQDPRQENAGRHIMECHRRLADLGGPNQAVFSAIADQLARELEANSVGPPNEPPRS